MDIEVHHSVSKSRSIDVEADFLFVILGVWLRACSSAVPTKIGCPLVCPLRFESFEK